MHATHERPLPRHRLLLRVFAQVQLFCFGVAVVIWLIGSPSFLVAWLYSAVIGLCCWALIDGGRLVIARLSGAASGWPGWGWMVPMMAVGGIGGYVGGTLIVDTLTGYQSALPARDTWRGWAGVLALSLATSLGATWYFYSRGRLAGSQAREAQLQQQVTQAQLQLLQSQLEPHMLFNTLANLRVLIGLDPPRAQAMLDRLIAFLRATLAASRSTQHPLGAEFARLDDYLALMTMRMGPRLQATLDLPQTLASLPVPPLLLQPLVENAIRHGLEPKVEGGSIRIGARREGDQLELTVHDDGLGLAAGRAIGAGFGTTQVCERLAARFGPAARFTLEPAAGGGTLARIVLPIADPQRAGHHSQPVP